MDSLGFAEATDAIIGIGMRFDAKGWAPATSGNYSCRLSDGSIAVTVSGTHKGRLKPADVMRVDGEGRPLDAKRPSAELSLHLAVYRGYPHAGCVLHTHSAASVALGRALKNAHEWRTAGHEMLKALPGISTHDTELALPIVDNSQDMSVIWDAVLPALDIVPAYLIRGHGLYGWGANSEEAERVIEAMEWLIACELAEVRLRQDA